MRAVRHFPERVSALVAALIVASCSASTRAQSTDPQPLTREQLNKLDRAEANSLPVLRVLPAIGEGMSEQSFYALVELELLHLRYLLAPPTGRASPQLTEAIKAFQRDLGQEDTGTLLFGEWEELMRRVGRVEPTPIYPDVASVIAVGDLARAEGTWVFESDDPMYTQANPIQTTVIECNRRVGTCVDATAVIWYREGAADLSVDLQTWHITKWSDSEIVAENDDARCVSYTLSINRHAKAASAFRRGKGTPGCEAFSTSPQILHLVNGLDVALEFFRKRDQAASEFISSGFKSSVQGLNNPAEKR